MKYYDALNYASTLGLCRRICSPQSGGTGHGWTGVAVIAMLEMAYAYTRNGEILRENKDKFGVTQLTTEAIELAINCKTPRVPEFRAKLEKLFKINLDDIKPSDLDKSVKLAFIVTRLFLESIADIPDEERRRAKHITFNLLGENTRGYINYVDGVSAMKIDAENHRLTVAK